MVLPPLSFVSRFHSSRFLSLNVMASFVLRFLILDSVFYGGHVRQVGICNKSAPCFLLDNCVSYELHRLVSLQPSSCGFDIYGSGNRGKERAGGERAGSGWRSFNRENGNNGGRGGGGGNRECCENEYIAHAPRVFLPAYGLPTLLRADVVS
jgi:hypothetical protein